MFFIMVVCTYTEDWKSDQYRWYQNGTKKLPGGGPVVKKVHYICVTPHGKGNFLVEVQLLRRFTIFVLHHMVKTSLLNA